MMCLQTRIALFFAIVLSCQATDDGHHGQEPTQEDVHFITSGPSGRRLFFDDHKHLGAAIGNKYQDQEWKIFNDDANRGDQCVEFYIMNRLSKAYLFDCPEAADKAHTGGNSGVGIGPHNPSTSMMERWVFEMQADRSCYIKNIVTGRCLAVKDCVRDGVGLTPAGEVSEINKFFIRSVADGTPFMAVDIEFDYEHSTQSIPDDINVDLINVTNRYAVGGENITKTFDYKCEEGRTTTLSASATLSASLETSVTTEIQENLVLENGKIGGSEKIGVKAEATVSGGTSWTETTTTEINDTIVCAPQKRVKVMLTRSKLKTTIPILATYKSGITKRIGQLVVDHGLKCTTDLHVHCLACDNDDHDCTCTSSESN